MTEHSLAEALRALDDVEAPDLWSAISLRSSDSYVSVRPPRRRRLQRPIAVAAAVLLLAGAFVVGRLSTSDRDVVIQDGPAPTATDAPWVVLGTAPAGSLAGNARPLLAASGDAAWLSSVGASTVTRYEGDRTPSPTASIDVTPIVDLAASGASSAVALGRDGSITELRSDGTSRRMADVGPDGSDARYVVVTGGSTWVGGGTGQDLLRVTPDGRVIEVPVPFPVGQPVADGDAVWIVDASGTRAARVTDGDDAVAGTASLGATTEPTAVDGALWTADPARSALVRTDTDLRSAVVAPLTGAVDALTTTDGRIWVLSASVLQAFRTDGSLDFSLVPVAPNSVATRIPSTMAGSGDRLWVAAPRRGELALIGPPTR